MNEHKRIQLTVRLDPFTVQAIEALQSKTSQPQSDILREIITAGLPLVRQSARIDINRLLLTHELILAVLTEPVRIQEPELYAKLERQARKRVAEYHA